MFNTKRILTTVVGVAGLAAILAFAGSVSVPDEACASGRCPACCTNNCSDCSGCKTN